jgi:oxalate decarboxylase
VPDYRYRLERAEARVEDGGTARGVSVREMPASTGIAGVSMRLHPGAMRELHWHANAAEWAYVLVGRCRATLVRPDGTYGAEDFAPGDVWYFPRGYGHAIETLGDEACHFILVFDDGAFSENATFSITDWIAHAPREAVAASLGVPAADLEGVPDHEVYMAVGPAPAAQAPSSIRPAAEGFRYPLGAAEPRRFPGGAIRTVSSLELPISRTMTGVLLDLEPGAVREMHWHPNSDEWQYWVAGSGRMSVFASSGKSSVVELEAGDVAYAPMGYGHAIENTGSDPCRLVVVFNSGIYEEIGLSSWLAANSDQLVATNLGLPPEVVARFPDDETFIG